MLAEAEKILGDVRNREDWAKALRGVDAVIHLAAYQDLLPHFSKFFEVNSVGTALLYELIVAGKLPVKKVVVASSQFVYGEGRYQCAEHGEVFPDGRDPQWLAAGIWEPICPRCHGSIKPLRVLRHGTEPVGEEYFAATLERAIDWRLKTLKLDEQTDAYRVVNSDGDGLSALTVDRYADVLSVKVNCLGVWQRLPGWLKLLHERLGTKREVIEVEPTAASGEGITPPSLPAGMRPVKVREHGVRYEVNFATGHKTGFFCDQRDNRRRFGQLVNGQRVLDLCCYTGGFAVAAAVLGQPTEVTGVDLDEEAIAQAQRNGNLNQRERIKWVHADAFAYARQMRLNGQLWGAVVCDPPKFLDSREADEKYEGRQKYEDLNRLAIALVEPGGVLVTCSCSGLWSMDEFERTVVLAVHKQSRRLQFFDRTGPGLDHPVMSNAMEGRYLKVLWARVY